jgi:hypothetical protein
MMQASYNHMNQWANADLMPFEITSVGVKDNARGIDIRFHFDFFTLDETKLRNLCPCIYTSKDFSGGFQFFESGFRYTYVDPRGHTQRAACGLIFLVPLDDTLWRYRVKYERAFGTAPTAAQEERYVLDIEQALRCRYGHFIAPVARRLGRHLEPMILTFDANVPDMTDMRERHKYFTEKGLQVLMQAERHESVAEYFD